MAAAGTDAMANYASLRDPVGMNRVFIAIVGETTAKKVDSSETGSDHIRSIRMASFLAPYENAEALKVARDLDAKVESLLSAAAA
jgi:hypothetical protein